MCFNNIKGLFTKPLALFDGTMAVKVTCNDFRTSFSVKGFNEVETRYKTSDGRTVKTTSESGSLPRKLKRRKTKEQPVATVTPVAAAVMETKESLSNEKKPQRITAAKKPSKYEKPSEFK